MAGRSSDQVKRELASEREHLGSAVRTLRGQVEAVRRKLPALALGAAAAGVVLRTVASRLRLRDR